MFERPRWLSVRLVRGGVDNLRHQQVALLPNEAFGVLGKLVTACERLGSMVPSLFVNLITFLVKPTRGVNAVQLSLHYTSR